MNWRRTWLVAATFLLVNSLVAQTNNTAVKINWSYLGNTGPLRWAQLSPDFKLCSTGQEQSPINIKKNMALAASSLTLDYKPAQLYIMDDGNTTLLLGNTQTIINDGHTIQANFDSKDVPETLNYNNVSYRLIQFHFHSPSETLMKSVAFPMEIHFVHQGPDGKVVVLAVLVAGGAANLELRKIINNIPLDQSVAHKIQGEKINPLDLLPKKLSYYAFAGSLTTPPCTEGLQWIVLADPITASPGQILRLRNLIGNNARPTQDLHKRVITYSEAH